MAARPESAATSPSDNAVPSNVCGVIATFLAERKHVYERQQLIDIRNSSSCSNNKQLLRLLSELGLLRRRGRKRRDRTRKRGKCGGLRARLVANPNKPPVPTLILANVRSLENKMDYIRLWRASQRGVRDCCVYVFTETWLNNNIMDSAMQLQGLTMHRADRVASLTGKERGGGLAVYVNNLWCQDSVTVSVHCSPHIELLTVKCRPFYLPRELTAVIITAVYVPPSAKGGYVGALQHHQ